MDDQEKTGAAQAQTGPTAGRDARLARASQAAVGERLLILGASVRAAAFSACRAGFCPLAGDLFGDADLMACCPSYSVRHYPGDLEPLARSLPPAPWFYTGGLENRPRLIDRIAAARPLYGNPGRVLRAVRNPFRLAKALAGEGLPCPALARQPGQARGGRWLRKPLRSSGGHSIEPLDANEPQSNEPCFFQQVIDGIPCSGVYVAAAGQALLLGITEQLVGTPWTGATGYRYTGSLGPLPVAEFQLAMFQRIGHCLADQFGLTGLFGVDAVLNEDGVWTIEVNPRYTASAEVVEWALGMHAVRWHVEACREHRLPSLLPSAGSGQPGPVPPQYCGKAIVFSRRSVRIGDRFMHLVGQLNQDGCWPLIADIPQPGSKIRAQRPVATVLAVEDNLPAVRARLQQRVQQVEQCLE